MLTIFSRDAVFLYGIQAKTYQMNHALFACFLLNAKSCCIVFLFYTSKRTQITVITGTTTSEWNEMTEKFVNQVASSNNDIVYLQLRKQNLVAGLPLSHAWVHFYIVVIGQFEAQCDNKA